MMVIRPLGTARTSMGLVVPAIRKRNRVGGLVDWDFDTLSWKKFSQRDVKTRRFLCRFVTKTERFVVVWERFVAIWERFGAEKDRFRAWLVVLLEDHLPGPITIFSKAKQKRC